MTLKAEAAVYVNTIPMNDEPPPATPEGEPAPVLPPPDFVGGDPVAMIAKLFVKSSQQKRESDNLTALTEERAEDAADAQRIEAMEKKASATFTAGIAGGLAQVGAGTCSIVGGVRSAKALNAPYSGQGTDLRAATADSVSKPWEGSSSITNGLGKVQEAKLKYDADGADQNIAKAESKGKVAKRAQDALRKEVDAAAQHEGKVVQLLQEIKQAQAQGERAALLKFA